MNNVETLVLQMIGENTSDPDVFTDDSTGMAQIRDSINDAIEEIAIITGGYRETMQFPLRTSRTFYRIVTTGISLAWITDMWLRAGKRRLEQVDLFKLNQFNPGWMKNAGPPRSYFPIGFNHVGFWPKPGSDGDIVECTFVAVPGRYTADTDRIKVRRDLEWAAAHFAVGEYWASRGDAKSAVMHHMDYANALGLDTPYHSASGYSARLRTQKEPWPKDSG